MRGEAYVQSLIAEKEQSGKIEKARLKGLSDDELRTLINATVSGGTAIKAAAFAAMKKYA